MFGGLTVERARQLLQETRGNLEEAIEVAFEETNDMPTASSSSSDLLEPNNLSPSENGCPSLDHLDPSQNGCPSPAPSSSSVAAAYRFLLNDAPSNRPERANAE
ncbi:unnamed protein product [Gongylonema pulchrum]|uniref:UBA domain-containing protein n=1 Tax=Gongylonema pulchrum TaxID=637853 RepID=A0A183ETJ7_9BILA|nr:unnamed protein product [Gongylonema pulchrum]